MHHQGYNWRRVGLCRAVKNIDAVVASSTNSRRSLNLAKRLTSGYEQVFAGTGTGPNDRDASIEGTAYLTYTVVDNSTYNVQQCLDFCDRVDGCGMLIYRDHFHNDVLTCA